MIKRPTSVEIGEPLDREVSVPCRSCGTVTSHKSLAYVTAHWSQEAEEFMAWDEYSIVQCMGCKTVCFFNEYSTIYDPPETVVFPKQIPGFPSFQGERHVPWLVRKIYTETYSALSNELPILAGVGIRAIVETVCKDRTAVDGNLEKRIDELVEVGIATKDGAKILHELRFMGNEAAHETRAHSLHELRIAMGVVHHLLQGVYVLPEEAKKLPKR